MERKLRAGVRTNRSGEDVSSRLNLDDIADHAGIQERRHSGEDVLADGRVRGDEVGDRLRRNNGGEERSESCTRERGPRECRISQGWSFERGGFGRQEGRTLREVVLILWRARGVDLGQALDAVKITFIPTRSGHPSGLNEKGELSQGVPLDLAQDALDVLILAGHKRRDLESSVRTRADGSAQQKSQLPLFFLPQADGANARLLRWTGQR